MKILMVCLGNICRSPMADGLLRAKVAQESLDIEVDSAGTSGYHVGDTPDPRMRATAKSMGVNIDDLTSRQFVQADYDRFDVIYAMDESNRDNMFRLARNEEDKQKVKLILNEIYPGENMSVPDPYYGGDQGFIDVFNMLDEATSKIISDIKG
ncbi:MAG: protein-tyrosine-phosphatase [Fluviicola sp. XM-24bin1]|nr:MAG: protein-tyrosine-phosphatase [Fluviicola sp. XM-24bin1]